MIRPLPFAEFALDDTSLTVIALGTLLIILSVISSVIWHLRKKCCTCPMRPEEKLVTCGDGYIGKAFGNGEDSLISGELIVTNHRIVFYSKGLFSEHTVGIDLKDIQAVDHKSGLGYRTISVRSPSSALEFNVSGKKQFTQLLDAIESQRKLAQSSDFKVAGVADELRKLSELTQEGILTHQDFQKAKELYLGKSPSKQDEAAKLLRNLYELFRAGALSESEFNMKKWDILARP
jgi:Bacterial PH domain/Short C-terminal domain